MHLRGTSDFLLLASAMGEQGEGVKEMKPGWSPAHERAVTLAFDKQTVSAPLDKTLGLDVPLHLQQLADEVIE